MKNILKVFFLSVLVFFCVGCADVEYSLSINKDDSANLEYLIKLENAKINIDMYSEILDSITEQLEENEFVVERNVNEIKAVKQIENILELDELDSLIKANGDSIIKKVEGLFTTEYVFDAKIDLIGYSKTAKELKLDKELKGLLNIKFNLTLPSGAKKTNSSIIKDKNLTWELTYGEENIIQAEYSLINAKIVVIPLLVVLIFGVIFVIVKIQKDRKQTIKF